MKYLFSGFYGYRNIGDDAFCVVADWGAQYFWHSSRNYFIGSKLPKLSNRASAVFPDKNLLPGHRTASLFSHALSCQRLVFFGGSTLHSEPARWMKAYSSVPAKLLLGKSVSAVGVSLGPFRASNDERSVRNFLKQMSFISLRDNQSFEIAKSMNLGVQVVRAFDTAILFPEARQGTASMSQLSSTEPTLAVSICNVERYVGGDLGTEARRVKWMTEVLKLLAARGIKLKFFVLNGDEHIGDLSVTREVISELQLSTEPEVFDYDKDTGRFIDSMLSCDAVFGTRLHASILAYAYSHPFLLVEYHRKCSDFLDEVGYDLSLRVGDGNVSPRDAASNLEELIAKRGTNRVKLSVSDARALALRNFCDAPYANI